MSCRIGTEINYSISDQVHHVENSVAIYWNEALNILDAEFTTLKDNIKYKLPGQVIICQSGEDLSLTMLANLNSLGEFILQYMEKYPGFKNIDLNDLQKVLPKTLTRLSAFLSSVSDDFKCGLSDLNLQNLFTICPPLKVVFF